MSALPEYDVIIVGAGISGLSAAHHLLVKEGSLRVLVLESSDQIGGKLHTLGMRTKNDKFSTFDMGAHFVSCKQPHLMQMIQSLKLNLLDQVSDGLRIGQANKKEKYIGLDVLEFLSAVSKLELNNFVAKIDAISVDTSFNISDYVVGYSYLDNIDLEEYMCSHLLTSRARETFRTIIRIICGVEPSEISVYYFLCLCNSTFGLQNFLSNKLGSKECYIQEGCGKIVRQLSSQIGFKFIKLREKVTTITQSEFYVTIETMKKKYICSYAILAIPLEDMSYISYEPDLGEDINNLFEESTDACILQFIATFDERYWFDQGLSGEVFSLEGPAQYIYDISTSSSYALTGLVYNIEGITASNELLENPERVKECIINQLSFLFGPQMENPIAFEFHNFSSPKPIGLGYAKALNDMTKLKGRLLFAGAETATTWRLHVSGAIQAGQRSATLALQELRPQCLNVKDYVSLHAKFYDASGRARTNFDRTAPKYVDLYGITGLLICAVIAYVARRVYKCMSLIAK